MPTLSPYDQKNYSGAYKKRTLKPRKPKKPGYNRKAAAEARKSGTSYKEAASNWKKNHPEKPGYDRKAAARARKEGISYKEAAGRGNGSSRSTPNGARAAAERRASRSGYPTNSEYNVTKKKYFRSIKDKRTDNTSTREMQAYRADRANRGDFKGNYYGPDAFKGDLAKVDRWRKAGGKQSDIKKIAKKYKRNTSRGD